MNREWMYRRFTSDGYISPEFHRGLESFIQFACDQPAYMDGNKIRCPCRKCNNLAYREVDTVRLHISSKGFMFNYHVWSAQGERQVMRERPNLAGSSSSAAGTSQYHQMVLDVAAGSSFNMDNQAPMDADIEEPPNPEAQKFYDMLRAADNELWPGCSKHSQLSLVARMINLKSENNISEKCFDGIAELMKEIVPDDNLLPDNFYKTKRLLRGMGLPVLKIDCCYHNCMLYWKHDIELDQCRICGYPRYDMRNKKRVAKHRGGSRSAVAYSYQMARDQGVSIKDTIFPTFKKLHYSERDNTYTSGKAKRIAEEVEVELEDLTQDLPDGVSPTPAETSSIFVAAAQHPVKNRVFGVGSLFSVPSVQSRWEGGGDEAPSMQCDSRLRAELDAVRSKFEAAEKAREDELQRVRSQLEAAEKAREDELQRVHSQLEASEKAREDMERRQDLLKELYQEQQREQRELREMCATQQRVMEQILRERNTPPDM